MHTYVFPTATVSLENADWCPWPNLMPEESIPLPDLCLHWTRSLKPGKRKSQKQSDWYHFIFKISNLNSQSIILGKLLQTSHTPTRLPTPTSASLRKQKAEEMKGGLAFIAEPPNSPARAGALPHALLWVGRGSPAKAHLSTCALHPFLHSLLFTGAPHNVLYLPTHFSGPLTANL